MHGVLQKPPHCFRSAHVSCIKVLLDLIMDNVVMSFLKYNLCAIIAFVYEFEDILNGFYRLACFNVDVTIVSHGEEFIVRDDKMIVNRKLTNIGFNFWPSAIKGISIWGSFSENCTTFIICKGTKMPYARISRTFLSLQFEHPIFTTSYHTISLCKTIFW